MKRYAAKRDSNHSEVFEVFNRLLAGHCTDTSAWGFGAGDLFVSFGRYCAWIEIKRDAKASYTAHQVRFQNTHPHAVLRCSSVDEAIELCGLIREAAGRLA